MFDVLIFLHFFNTFILVPEDDATCDCRPLPTCGVLWSNLILAKETSVWDHFKYTEYLKSLNCGYLFFMPFVCCPFQDYIDESDTFELNSDEKSVSLKTPKCLLGTKKTSTGLPDTLPTKLSTAPIRATTALPSTTTQNSVEKPDEKENHNFAECGRSINRDHHLGNRTELSDFPWLALLEYDTRK